MPIHFPHINLPRFNMSGARAGSIAKGVQEIGGAVAEVVSEIKGAAQGPGLTPTDTASIQGDYGVQQAVTSKLSPMSLILILILVVGGGFLFIHRR